jgi:hypothetical protein
MHAPKRVNITASATMNFIPNIAVPVFNRGTGAGGANTNLYGKKFEEFTNNEPRLLAHNYLKVSMGKKNQYYLLKKNEDCEKIFVTQGNLKLLMKTKFGISMFRNPDEAYITIPSDGSPIHIKILEKKEQNVEGSVETKLLSGPSFKREYKLVLGERFNVSYAFCVNSFLQKKIESTDSKYVILNQILRESEIPVLFGDESNYFAKLDEWLTTEA